MLSGVSNERSTQSLRACMNESMFLEATMVLAVLSGPVLMLAVLMRSRQTFVYKPGLSVISGAFSGQPRGDVGLLTAVPIGLNDQMFLQNHELHGCRICVSSSSVDADV